MKKKLLNLSLALLLLPLPVSSADITLSPQELGPSFSKKSTNSKLKLKHICGTKRPSLSFQNISIYFQDNMLLISIQ